MFLPFFSDRRFTGQLAKNAKSVVAVDFMEKFISKNRAINSCHSNIEFHCADVTKLDLPDNKYVFFFFLKTVRRMAIRRPHI